MGNILRGRCAGACAGFFTGGGGRRCGTKIYRGLIAGYTDREDLEAFILSKTGGEQGRGFQPLKPPLDTHLV